MRHNNIEFAVLIKGRPITEFHHRGQVFVEGRAGSEYEIEIRNNTHGRVEVVLSVDGLSVIDGKAAGPQSSGYLIEGNKSIRIPGWTLDNTGVANFAFSDNRGSYTGQTSGDTHNNGVIGIMAFAEKYVRTQYQYTQLVGSPTPWPSYYPWQGLSINNAAVGSGPKYMAESTGNRFGSVVRGTSGISGSGVSSIAASACSMSVEQKTSGGIVHETFSDDAYGHNSVVQNSLGTAFGERSNFATTKVEFTRGDMIAMMVLYYDEARGLKARGIKMERPSKKKYANNQPDAFPAMPPQGCKPPPGWRG